MLTNRLERMSGGATRPAGPPRSSCKSGGRPARHRLAAPVLAALSRRLQALRRRSGARRRDARRFAAGEVLALVGENGAGKSTLMRIFEGVLSARPGRLVSVGGRSADASLAARRPRARHPGHPPGAGDHPRPVDRRESRSSATFAASHGVFLDRARSRAADPPRCSPTFGLENDLGPGPARATSVRRSAS